MIKKAFAKLKEYNYRNTAFRLLLYIYVLSIIGINVIDSAAESESYAQRQLIGLLVSTVILVIFALIDYNLVLKFYWIYYIINLILLLVVQFAGATHGGAKRWIDIPGFQLQPSELSKLLLVLFFAKLLSNYSEYMKNFKIVIASGVLVGLPVLLILKQPDLSTSIVICLTFCVILFVAGLGWKIIGALFAIAIPLVVIFVYLVMQPDQQILQGYQLERIQTFYDEDAEGAEKLRYQQENSILAIGSGGLYGKGLHNNTITSVKNGNYLSEPHTDFIFTVVGEELGFVGSASVIILLLLIVLECFIIGSRAPNLEGKIICCGTGALIAFQSFINLAVVTMLIPNTGLTLPFVSYGINSLLSTFAAMGIVVNVGLQRKRAYYEEV
jgi:rod shape determining protein RodA